MIYETSIREIKICGCEEEGDMIVEINGIPICAYYQAPKEFLQNNILNPNFQSDSTGYIYKFNSLSSILSERYKIDLWFTFGNIRKVEFPNQNMFCKSKNGSNYLSGKVIRILSENELRVDCGNLIIDINNESKVDYIVEGDYIEALGSYQVYFLNLYSPCIEYNWH